MWKLGLLAVGLLSLAWECSSVPATAADFTSVSTRCDTPWSASLTVITGDGAAKEYTHIEGFMAFNDTTVVPSPSSCYATIPNTTASTTLQLSHGLCSTPAGVANVPITMSFALFKLKDLMDSDTIIANIQCTYNGDGSVLNVASAGMTPSEQGKTPIVLGPPGEESDSKLEFLNRFQQRVETCNIGNAPEELTPIVSLKKGTFTGASILELYYNDAFGQRQMIVENSCSLARPYIIENRGTRPAQPIWGAPDRWYAKMTTHMICFASAHMDKIQFEAVVGACGPNNAAHCNNACINDNSRKRRSSDNGIVYFNVTAQMFPVRDPEEVEPRRVCANYTSNTVFYSVVVVLAVLLVLTIGLAAYFGSRAREVIFRSPGKDNPVYS